jgi:hypothetical protein
VTLGLDILLLNIDPNLWRVREREYAGYAMRAADLIELAVAGRVTLTGRWVKWVTVVDATPTGDPLLGTTLAGLVHQCTLWIPGHFDRAAQRKFKEAAKGERARAKPVRWRRRSGC